MKRIPEFKVSVKKKVGPWLLTLSLLLPALTFFSCSSKDERAGESQSGASSSPSGSVELSREPVASAMPAGSSARKTFKTGEAVPAGSLGYKVYGSWFSDHLAPSHSARASDSYLFVEFSVVNTDKKERPIGLLKLVDEGGREYPLSEKANATEQSVSQIGKLGPSTSKRAVAIFEVPRGHEYKLKVQGFTSGDEVMIELSPKPSGP